MIKKYYSKRSKGLAIPMFGPCLFLIFIGFYQYHRTGIWTFDIFVVWGIALLVSGLMSSIWFNTYYLLEAENLVAVSGFFKIRVPYSEMLKVERTNSPLNAPALTMKRVRIKFGKWKEVLIAPQEEAEFFEILAEKAPQIEFKL